MKRPERGFTPIDLLALVAVGGLLIAIGAPVMFRARELSRRMVCCQNLTGLGATAKIYSGQNGGSWMAPAFKNSYIDAQGIDYTNQQSANSSTDPGSVGHNRTFRSLSETPANPTGGTTAVSTTRAFWMLVRSGDVDVHQFVCPSSGDVADPTEDVDLYYDFTGYNNISYGYQVPFGPPETRPREGADVRQVFAADKGPFYSGQNLPVPTWQVNGRVLLLTSPIASWSAYNSPNHGGKGKGEGQNCLFADTHVSFQRIPAIGVDSDNIYTVIFNENWQDPRHENIIHGDTVWHSAAANPYPGQNAFGNGPNKYASTDSLIYP